MGARLKPGVTLGQANARLRIVGDEYSRMYPAVAKGQTFAVKPVREAMVADVRSSLPIPVGAVSEKADGGATPAPWCIRTPARSPLRRGGQRSVDHLCKAHRFLDEARN